MEWNIVQLDCYPEKDGETDVVFTAHWEVTATEGEYSGRVYGSVGVTLDDKEPFTPFDKLTKEQVVGWVKDSLCAETVSAHEANVLQQIKDAKNPPVVRPPLPWTPLIAPLEETAA